MEDFIPVYPPANHPDIQRIITAKKEFNELEPVEEQDFSKQGLLNHQVLFQRVSLLSDRILNIFETGAGKTCAFIALAEHYKFTGAYTKAIIVESSDALNLEVGTQILERCAPEAYNLDITSRDTVKIKKRKKREALKQWYDMRTYQKLANDLEQMTDFQISSRFRNTLIIFDEAHNMVSSDETDKTEISNSYNQYMRLCQNAVQCKIILVTATPMTNNYKSIVSLMNLILPPGGQIPNKEHYRMSELEPYFRGKVSYYKPKLSDVEVQYMGKEFIFSGEIRELHPFDPTLDPQYDRKVDIPMKMFLSKMGDLQVEQYRSIVYSGFIRRHLNPEEKHQASFVYPIINGNPTRMEDYISFKDGKLSWHNNPDFLKWEHRGSFASFHEWIKEGNSPREQGDKNPAPSLNNLARISGKMAEIIKIEKSETGCSFIYHDDVNLAGVKTIVAVLQLFGFEQFTESSTEDIFIDPRNTKIKESFKKRPRVAMLIGETSVARKDTIKTLFNSPENVNGDYIKIVVGSSAVKEGINLYHCQRMHLYYPLWNYSSITQAVNRVLRISGHQYLRKVKEALASERGLVPGSKEYQDFTKIIVKVFIHAIDYRLDGPPSEVEKYNVDYYLMKTVVKKQIPITQMMNMIKSFAVDCIINREANRIGLTDPFNYDKITYIPSWTEIVDPGYVPYVTDPMDYSTYNILYVKTDHIIRVIQKFLLLNGSISYNNIFDLFRDSTRPEIYNAVELFKSKYRFIENEYGERLNVESGANGLHIQRFKAPVNGDLIPDISIYDRPTVVINSRPISDHMRQYTERIAIDTVLDIYRKNIDLFEDLQKLATEGHRIVDTIKSYNRWIRVLLLEFVLERINGYSEDHEDGRERLVGLLSNYILLTEIRDVFTGYYFSFKSKGYPVIVHTLQINPEKTSHNIPKKHKKPSRIKIMEIGGGRSNSTSPPSPWRLPIGDEFKLYSDLISESIDNDMKKYEKHKIYGTILKDGKTRIIDPFSDHKAALEGDQGQDKKDLRQAKTGSNPTNMKSEDRALIAAYENIPVKPGCDLDVGAAEANEYFRVNVPDKIVWDMFSSSQIINYYKWRNCSDIGKYFNDMIVAKLKKTDRLYAPFRLYDD